jgi:YHS domain-containing protein
MKYLKLTGPIAALALSVLAASAYTTPSFALVAASTSAVNTNEAGLALQGYDAVAYFKAGAPTKGDAKFRARYEGATYQFANAENLKAFRANPAAFAPQFGGFCAMGVALDKKLDGDPNVWKVVDGKLYLNVNQDVSVAWNRNLAANIDTAVEKWPTIRNKTPESLN